MLARRVVAAVASACAIGSSLAQAQTFRHVTTEPGLRLDHVAVVDFNGDGRDDVIAGGRGLDNEGETPEDRWTRKRLYVFASEGDGRFRYAPELVAGTIEARYPIMVAADFNSDGRDDLAIFDAGVYISPVGGHGNPPQLLLSSPFGQHRPSNALAEAVRREHELRPEPFYSGASDLHIKSASTGDIDADGDTDLWVESSGGANVISHFMVNNGDGTFTIDSVRAPYDLLHNPHPEFWRHRSSDLVDLDNDGDLDLALGQMRDLHPTHVNQFSIVLVNDGTGHYPSRVELPHPDFNNGYTQVYGLTHFDVNGDGLQDLLLVHQRNDDGPPNVLPWTGRYVQVLVNRGGMLFDDETSVWMGDQSATTPERGPDGDPLSSFAEPRMHDVDRDGCQDLVMSASGAPVRTESPLVYRNDGTGRFQALPPEPFAGTEPYFGYYAQPADVDGDAVIDFVVPRHHNGPDGRYDTADDFTTLVALLNTTPAGSARCNPPVKAVGTLPARTLSVGPVSTAAVVPLAGAFRHASNYRASSSAPAIAAVSLSGSAVTVTSIAAGAATITVTAGGADNSTAIQRFKVTVVAEGSSRASEFLKLRRRIEALRARERLRPAR